MTSEPQITTAVPPDVFARARIAAARIERHGRWAVARISADEVFALAWVVAGAFGADHSGLDDEIRHAASQTHTPLSEI